MITAITRPTNLLCAICLLLAAILPSLAHAATPTAIVISPNASKVASFAADELQLYIAKTTGKTLPIVTTANDAQSNIYVGPSAFTEALNLDTKALYPDGYLIKSIDDNIVILGDDADYGGIVGLPFDPRSTRKGTLYGVYRFLENQLGVRWLWPGDNGEVINANQSLDLPENLNTQSKPVMLWRHLFLNGQSTLTEKDLLESYKWYMRQGMGISTGSPGSFAHSWAYLMDGNKNFEAHPEWYSLLKGKRTPFATLPNGKVRAQGQQVCTSNPEVVEYFVNKITSRYAPDADVIVNLSPNDGQGFCECDNCTALDFPNLYSSDEGYQGVNYSDRIFGFVSQVAAGIKKTHPNVRVGCFAYTFASEAPRGLKSLDENVVVSFTQTIQNTNRDPQRLAKHRKRLDAWLNMGNKVVLRDYFGYIGQAAALSPISGWIKDEIDNATQHPDRIFGFYSETTYAGMYTNALDFYIMARLTWDPSQDITAIKADYFEHGFLSAAQPMSQFHALLENAYTSVKREDAAFLQGIDLWLTPSVKSQAYNLLDQATAAAKGNADVTARINTTRTIFDYTVTLGQLVHDIRTMADAGLPMRLPGYTPQPLQHVPASAQLIQMIDKASRQYDKTLATIQALEDHDTIIYAADGFKRREYYWRWGATLAEYRELFADQSRVPTTLPVVWKFKLDPEKVGETQNWYTTSLDSQWSDIRIDDVWENQGYGKDRYDHPEGYNGLAWYRLDNLTINQPANHKTILWIGAVDESCKVYVNGKYIGQSIYDPAIDPDGWKKARQFDISSAVIQGANNTIAIQVQDNSGHGGIWKSAWLLSTAANENAGDQPLDLFNENFEAPGWQNRAVKVNANEDDKVEQVEGVLKIQTAKGLPDGSVSITWLVKDIPGNSNLSFEIKARTQNIEENADLKPLWQRRPKAPQIRLMPINDKGKAAVAPKEYQWLGLNFAESSDGWQRISRVFRVTEDTNRLSITLFLHAKGEYELDDMILRQVK